MKNLILSAIVFLSSTTAALAIDTSQTYNSGILVLLFVGFCALIIVAQLVPAILMLVGMTKAVIPQRKKVKA